MKRPRIPSAILALTMLLMILALAYARPAVPDPFSAQPAGDSTGHEKVTGDFGRLPLLFVENQGQWADQVAYAVQGRDKTLYFTAEGITFALTAPTEGGQPESASNTALLRGRDSKPARSQRWVVRLDFLGANQAVRPVGEVPDEAVISYFKGRPEEWHAGLPTYRRLAYRDLWPGIDLVYDGTVSRLKYHFLVHPGADPSQIRLAYRGASDLVVNDAGQLEVTTPLGGFQDDVPLAYQEIDGQRAKVELAYALEAAAGDARPYHFELGDYDTARPLVLDPAVFVYSGFIGGDGGDRAWSIAVDGSGNAYVTGGTTSGEATFPVAVGPDPTFNGNWDVFVVKVNPSGTALVYAGYLGGDNQDEGFGIAIDSVGNAYLTGRTQSDEATFPVAVGPDLTHNGDEDAFVAKVNADGTSLDYAGYVGGASADHGATIAVDGNGAAFIAGYTISSEATFPVTVGPDLTYNDEHSHGDAFVAKVSAAGSGLVYAGYIGGSYFEQSTGIAVDSSGAAYVSGLTYSSHLAPIPFPVTVGPDLTYNGGDYDAFVAKVHPAGTGLSYAGYVGGIGADMAWAIDLDDAGGAYLAGATNSDENTFPVSVGPDLTHNGLSDAFIVRVLPDGTGLSLAGYLGGSNSDTGNGIALDSAGNIYLTGQTSSTEDTFPVIAGPDLTENGGRDAFIAKVSAAGTELIYAGYVGGGDEDNSLAIAVDGADQAYVVGETWSGNGFPVIVGPDLTFNSGSFDAFVTTVRYFTSLPYDTYLPIVLVP